MKKKMIDVKVFSSGGREEKVRLFNIPGTDDYYVSGKEFDAKSSKYYGVLYFMVPDQRIGDEDEYHPITDLPDYVRKIYRMDDGQITEMVYDNTYGKEQDGKTEERDKIIKTITLFEVILEYQDEIDELKRELEKTTNDSVRQAIKDRILWLAENTASCMADARILAGMWVKYLEENSIRKEI